jgi:ABC-type sugar transport system permease subunit
MDAARLPRGRSSSSAIEEQTRTRSRAALGASAPVRAAFIWPALLAILFVSVFPLLVSLYISLSRLKLVRGGFEFRFVGLDNFRELFVGGERPSPRCRTSTWSGGGSPRSEPMNRDIERRRRGRW